MSKKEKVLIVGGGFGGVKAGLELDGDDHFEVTLLSDETNLKYYPTLYRAATGTSRANASIPLSSIFANTEVIIKKGQAVTLDRKAKTVTTASDDIYPYDYLILSTGVVTNYFNIPGLDEYSYGIKSIEQAKRFKDHLHKQLIDEHRPDINYVIVGAGPTGIELAGALPDYLNRIIKNHGLKPKNIHIDLIEAMPRLLPSMPRGISRVVKRRLKKLGIRLYLNSKVEGESVDALTVNGKPIKSHSVVWTAGVTNNPFFKNNNFVITSRGKVSVNAYMETEQNIYVIGDNANTPFSGMAQTAISDGAFVAENLRRKVRSKNLKSYKAMKPITVIPAGPGWAVVLWGHFYFQGFIGYLLREVADVKGFKDLEPWSMSVKQFLSEFVDEEDCQVCAVASR